MASGIALYPGNPNTTTNDIRKWENWDDPGVAEKIDKVWEEDDLDFEHSHRKNLSVVIKPYVIDSTVLEVGCGSGLVYKELVPEIIPNEKYTGCDSSLNMLDIARSKYSGKFVYGDIYNLPFPSASFDTVLCFEVLCHLFEIKVPIKELIRVARKKVIFTIWISDKSHLFGAERFMDSDFIYQFYTKEEVAEAINQTPVIVESQYLHTVGTNTPEVPIYCWMYKVSV
jgi:ubiquinone/menaquinone biosynthesis C-methylase UbiE